MPQAAIGMIPEFASTALGALGLGGQMAGSKQQQKILSQQQQMQQQAFNNLQNLYQKYGTMTPGQESQQWGQLVAPISANQMLGVSNAVAPQMAGMGLGESAGQLAQAMAPTLAQYQGQNQALAAQMLQNMQQLPLQAAGAEAGMPTFSGGMFQQPGQGQSGAMFQGGLQSLLNRLPWAPGPAMPPGASINPSGPLFNPLPQGTGGIQIPTDPSMIAGSGTGFGG